MRVLFCYSQGGVCLSATDLIFLCLLTILMDCYWSYVGCVVSDRVNPDNALSCFLPEDYITRLILLYYYSRVHFYPSPSRITDVKLVKGSWIKILNAF